MHPIANTHSATITIGVLITEGGNRRQIPNKKALQLEGLMKNIEQRIPTEAGTLLIQLIRT